MPLDTGAVTHSLLISADVDISDAIDRPDFALEGAANVGAILRATRLSLGRSLQDVSDATRIRRSYLQALEEMRLEDLPSRPFTIGYVRAYARALDLDGEAAVARFRQDAPVGDEALQAPVGVRKHADTRLSLLAGAGAAVISAVLLWNLVQHAMAEDTPPPPVVAEASSPASATPVQPATVAISAAQPAPQESTTPAPYLTPGLAPAPNQNSAPASDAAALANEADAAAFQTFTPHGEIYGAPATASTVTLQARKSVSLVIRSPDGQVRFAQMLKAGEAYRAPMMGSLTLDVSDPAAMRVYVAGQRRPDLTAALTSLSKLTPAG